jgi:hypothetical protein
MAQTETRQARKDPRGIKKEADRRIAVKEAEDSARQGNKEGVGRGIQVPERNVA